LKTITIPHHPPILNNSINHSITHLAITAIAAVVGDITVASPSIRTLRLSKDVIVVVVVDVVDASAPSPDCEGEGDGEGDDDDDYVDDDDDDDDYVDDDDDDDDYVDDHPLALSFLIELDLLRRRLTTNADDLEIADGCAG